MVEMGMFKDAQVTAGSFRYCGHGQHFLRLLAGSFITVGATLHSQQSFLVYSCLKGN